MAEDLIWCSAQLPHPYEVGVRVRMWWHPPPQRSYKGPPAKAPCVAVKDGDRPQMRTNVTAGIALRHRGFLHVQPPPPQYERIPMTPDVQLPRGIQSPTASDADWSLAGFRRVDCPLRLLIDEAFSSYRDDDGDWCDARRTRQPCSSYRHATLISHLFASHEPAPEFLNLSPRQSPGPALKSDQLSQRPTDKLQILSWNPGPATGSDPNTLASHLTGPWHVICVQEGAAFSLAVPWRKTSTWSPSTIPLFSSTRTLTRATSRVHLSTSPARSGIPCGLSRAWWLPASSAGRPTSRAPTSPSRISTSTTNAQKRRSVCVALLLLTRDLCLKLGAVVPTGDLQGR